MSDFANNISAVGLYLKRTTTTPGIDTTRSVIYTDDTNGHLKVIDANNTTVDLSVAGGVTDHGALTGLIDDDHTQYALLAGRAGGQTIIGGNATGNTLSLQPNSAGDNSGSINLQGTTSISGVLVASGAATMQNTLDVTSNATISGDLRVNNITSRTTNADLMLDPQGTGKILANADLCVNNILSLTANADIVLNPDGTGQVNVSDSRITNLAMPINFNDAATKEYADAIAAGFGPKLSVRVKTTDNDLTTLLPGTTIANPNISGTGTLPSIDGVTLTDGDRLLLAGTTANAAYGIYIVTVTTPNWELTRANDADNTPTVGEVTKGIYTFVTEGTEHANQGWSLVIYNEPATLGVTEQTWSKVSQIGTGSISHSTLTNLTNSDDHTQYFYMQGRAGGQTIFGGNNNGENLTINSTFGSSKGSVIFPETKDSTIPTDGAVVISGGVGIGGNVNVGGNLNVNGTMGIDSITAKTLNTDLLLNGNGSGGVVIGTALSTVNGISTNTITSIDADDDVFVNPKGVGKIVAGKTITTPANTDLILDPHGMGVIDVTNNKITNVAVPTENVEAANKLYVDTSIINDGNVKLAVRVKPTDSEVNDILTGTMNGSGYGNKTITSPNFAPATFDGVSLVLFDRVLVAAMSGPSVANGNQGIYELIQQANGINQGWVLRRTNDSLTENIVVLVFEGTTNNSTIYRLKDFVGPIDDNLSPQTWQNFQSQGVNLTRTVLGQADQTSLSVSGSAITLDPRNFTTIGGSLYEVPVNIISYGEVLNLNANNGNVSRIDIGNADTSSTTVKSVSVNIYTPTLNLANNSLSTVNIGFDGGSTNIRGVTMPNNNGHAANKLYVDNNTLLKEYVLCRTTNTEYNTIYNNSTYSGNYLESNNVNITLDNLLPTIDSTSYSVNDRIAVMNLSTDHPEQGIYVVTNLGNGNDTPWRLTRASDFAENTTLKGKTFNVIAGTEFGGTGYTFVLDDTTPGTGMVTFARVSGFDITVSGQTNGNESVTKNNSNITVDPTKFTNIGSTSTDTTIEGGNVNISGGTITGTVNINADTANATTNISTGNSNGIVTIGNNNVPKIDILSSEVNINTLANTTNIGNTTFTSTGATFLGVVNFTSSTNSVDTSTGAIVIPNGGLGVAGTVNSSGITTSVLQVDGTANLNALSGAGPTNIGTGSTGDVTIATGSSGSSVIIGGNSSVCNISIGSLTKSIIVNPNSTGINMSSTKITNLAIPTLPTDATTKEYVDAVAQGFGPKLACRVKTITNEANDILASGHTFAGTGPSKTITKTTFGALSIDGVTLAVGDRVLFAGGTSASQHYGIYTVTNTGSAGTSWILTRSSDANDDPATGEVTVGIYTFITEGTTHASQGWSLVTYTAGGLDVGAQTWSQTTSAGGGITTITSAVTGQSSGNNSLVVSGSGAGRTLTLDPTLFTNLGSSSNTTSLIGSSISIVSSGNVSLTASAPSASNHIITKNYVDTLSLSGDVTGTPTTTSISNAVVIGKSLTGFISNAGPITSSDTILSAINKLDARVPLSTATYIPYYTSPDTLGSEAAFVYNTLTNTMAVDNIVSAGITAGTSLSTLGTFTATGLSTLGAVTATGAVNINTTGSAVTNIGAGSSGSITIGNGTTNQQINIKGGSGTGFVLINHDAGSTTTNIGTGTTDGGVLIGGGSNLVTINPSSTGLSLSNKKIINLATPTNANDAVTKTYVDSLITNPEIITVTGRFGTTITPSNPRTLINSTLVDIAEITLANASTAIVKNITLTKNSTPVEIFTSTIRYTLDSTRNSIDLLYNTVTSAWEQFSSNTYPVNQDSALQVKIANVSPTNNTLGYSVAISRDGNHLVAGAATAAGGIGGFICYDYIGGVWRQSGSIIQGNGNTGASTQGWSIAISKFGNTVAVGGPTNNTNVGAVWIFDRDQAGEGSWIQTGSPLVGGSNIGQSRQGSSVALSDDGNTVAFGGPGDNADVGATWVFTRNASNAWVQQAKITATSGVQGAAIQQGTSVALSGDGNTLASGARAETTSGVQTGAAWIFTRSGGTWSQQARVAGTGNTGIAAQGDSVALSLDGNTLAVGGALDNTSVGATWIFTRSGGTWTQQGSKLVGTGFVSNPPNYVYQGGTVSISDNGDTLAVGGQFDNSSTGSTWIFTRSGGVWTQQGSKLVATDGVGLVRQGFKVALSGRGDTVVSGGIGDNSVGALWIFRLSGTAWQQFDSKLSVRTVNVNGNVASSCTISGDGNTMALGSETEVGFVGVTHIYIKSNGRWIYQTNLSGSSSIGTSRQGAVGSIALSFNGNTLAIGGYTDNSSVGAVWMFTRTGTVWAQEAKLVGPSTNNFGSAVALSNDGNTLVVGASFTSSPSAHIYTKGTSWASGVTSVTFLGATSSSFGYSVAISGDGIYVAVGAPLEASNTGTVSLYSRLSGAWTAFNNNTTTNKLTPDSNAQSCGFGASVSLSRDGKILVVGAPSYHSTSNDQTYISIFVNENGFFSRKQFRIIGSPFRGNNLFGASVKVSANGNVIAVGWPGYLTTSISNNSSSGCVAIFVKDKNNIFKQKDLLFASPETYLNTQLGINLSMDDNASTIVAITSGGTISVGNGRSAFVFT